MKKILLIDDSDTYIWNLRKYFELQDISRYLCIGLSLIFQYQYGMKNW